MMTGAILGGSSVQQAAKLQMVIMFMISSSSALSSILVTVFALMIVVDGSSRIRTDRIDVRDHIVWRTRDAAVGRVVEGVKGLVGCAGGKAREELEAVRGGQNH